MEQPSFIFSSDNIQIKSEGENFFVEGYISTSDLDLVNDVVTKNCLLDMADQMKTRNIKFDVEHESFRGKSDLDREINKTIIPVAKVDDFLMDKKGLKVRAMLNNHSQRFDEVKGSITDGFLDAFSIAYVPIKSAVQEKNGQQVRMLDKINLLNVAFTGNPVNTEAKMSNVFAKSLEYLKEQEKARGEGQGNGGEKQEDGGAEICKCPKCGTEYKKEKGTACNEKTCPKCKVKLEGKSYIHKGDTIKLQEVKNMSEEEKETTETEESKEAESTEETKDEESEESEEAKEEESENAEVKAIKSELNLVKKELIDIKAALKKPMRKSKVEQLDKSENFVAEVTKNPLDLIA